MIMKLKVIKTYRVIRIIAPFKKPWKIFVFEFCEKPSQTSVLKGGFACFLKRRNRVLTFCFYVLENMQEHIFWAYIFDMYV